MQEKLHVAHVLIARLLLGAQCDASRRRLGRDPLGGQQVRVTCLLAYRGANAYARFLRERLHGLHAEFLHRSLWTREVTRHAGDDSRNHAQPPTHQCLTHHSLFGVPSYLLQVAHSRELHRPKLVRRLHERGHGLGTRRPHDSLRCNATHAGRGTHRVGTSTLQSQRSPGDLRRDPGQVHKVLGRRAVLVEEEVFDLSRLWVGDPSNDEVPVLDRLNLRAPERVL